MTSSNATRVLLYGDVNLNVLDGSAVWLTSMAEVVARAGAEVVVLLKAPVIVDRLTGRLDELGVTVVPHRPAGGSRPLSAQEAARRMREETVRLTPDVVIARGDVICERLARDPVIAPMLWAYVTEIPHPTPDGTIRDVTRLRRIAAGTHRLFVQTPQARDYLESFLPELTGKTVLLNPMVPEDSLDDTAPAPLADDHGLRLVYSGKMAREWLTLEMLDLPGELAERGTDASLTVLGDKVHHYSDDPGWSAAMAAAMERYRSETAGRVRILGGLARKDAMQETARHQLGLSWRSPELDSSLEISTKVLEYCALGVAPVLNDTVMHRELLGDDYPFFVTGRASVIAALERAAREPETLAAAAASARAAVAPYLMSASAERIRVALAHGTRSAEPVKPGGVSPATLTPGAEISRKIPGSQFHLGVMGVNTELTGVVDVLRELVAEDRRFVLHVWGRAPWSRPWEWREAQPNGLADQLRDLVSGPLQDHVVLENDSESTLASKLRRVGWLLVPEGAAPWDAGLSAVAATGAIPVVWGAPAGTLDPDPRWVVSGAREAAARVRESVLASAQRG